MRITTLNNFWRSVDVNLYLVSALLFISPAVSAVQVVKQGQTVSISDLPASNTRQSGAALSSPAGAAKSTRIYPASDKQSVIAATEEMSDFADPPMQYDAPADSGSASERDGAKTPVEEPIDSSIPLDKIPLDKISSQAPSAQPADRGNPQWELIRQLTALQQEVSELRGKLEQQSQQISVMEAQQKQRYLDLDSRLEALQGGLSIPTDAKMSSSSSMSSNSAEPSAVDSEANSEVKVVEAEESVVGITKPKSTPLVKPAPPSDSVPSAKMLQEYESAQSLLKDKKLKSAKQAFTQFTQNYPESDLTGDAYYWLGEIALASQPAQESSAKTQFTKVVDEFADSKKVPHALYKLALLEIRSGSKVRAKTLLLRLKKEYPSSSPAKLADAQLKYIKDNP